MMGGLVFFSPAPHPANEAERQAALDGIRLDEAAADPRLADLVERAAAIFGAPSAAISIVGRERQEWIVRTGLEADGSPRALSFCGHVVAAPDKVLVVPDATVDTRFAGNPLVNGAMADVRFYAGAALKDGDAALGALCVVDGAPGRGITAAQRAELATLADEVAAILRTYR